MSPTENKAPSFHTGRSSLAPSVRCLMSMFPPCFPGGMTWNWPFSLGATPITPQNGFRGTLMPFLESPSHIQRKGSLNSGKSPSGGLIADQPQSDVDIFTTSTESASPAEAPSTYTGPERG